MNRIPRPVDYQGHPLYEEIEESVSKLIHLLDRYGYSGKALYVAQECLCDELFDIEYKIRGINSETKRLRKEASELARDSKKGDGSLPPNVKNETKRLYQRVEILETERRILQYGRWLLRYVGDGIAWHAFGFDRKYIRALASKQSVSAVSNPGNFKALRRFFRGVRKLGKDWFPVLHDLTNCLRTGDISVFRNGDLVKTLELKILQGEQKELDESERLKRNNRSQRQVARLERISRFLETEDLGDLDPQLIGGKSLQSDLIEKHNFEAVSQAISTAREVNYGFETPEAGVLYIAVDLQEGTPKEAVAIAVEKYPDIFTSGLMFRSMEPRFENSHLDMPITAMEMPSDDILDIVFQRVGVITVINNLALEKFCEENDIPLHIVINPDNKLSIRVEYQTYEGEVQNGLWDRVMLEALSLESFCGLIRSIHDSSFVKEITDGTK